MAKTKEELDALVKEINEANASIAKLEGEERAAAIKKASEDFNKKLSELEPEEVKLVVESLDTVPVDLEGEYESPEMTNGDTTGAGFISPAVAAVIVDVVVGAQADVAVNANVAINYSEVSGA